MNKCKSCGVMFEYEGNKLYCPVCREKQKEWNRIYRKNNRSVDARRENLTSKEVEYIISLAKTHTIKEIAELTNCSYGAIQKRLHAEGVKAIKKKKPLNGKAKKIIELRKDEKTQKEIADSLDTSVDYVRKVLRENGFHGAIKKAERTNRLTGHEFVLRHRPECEYIDGYENKESVIKIKYKKCGHIYSIKAKSLFKDVKNYKCPICEENKQDEKFAEIERQKFIKEIKKKGNLKFKQIGMKTCPICNSVFVGSSKYCSDYCFKQNKQKMKDGYRYDFPLEDIFDRDDGICYLCGEKCDWNDFYFTENGVKVYGNLYPSRDHVIPKSKGGANSWDNIRLAHRICNSVKSDKECLIS